MMRYRYLRQGWIVFIFCMASSLSFGQENLPALVKRIEPSIVVVLTYDNAEKMQGLGSGFFVSGNGDVITNYHVLQGASQAVIRTSDGKAYPVKKVVAEDRDGDLIRISVDIPENKVSPLSISPSLPDVGERIAVIGTPLGLEKTVSDGIVAAIREVPEFGKIIQLTAPISSGSSGSPVVNMRGEVIGIATFFILQGQNLNFAIPAERIKDLKQAAVTVLSEREEGRVEESIAFAERLYATGLRFLWVEAWDQALPYFVEAVRKNRLYAQAYFQIGFCQGKLGHYQEAIQPYQEAIRIKPEDAEIHSNLCVAYGMVGRYDEAIESCKHAIGLRPDLAEAHNNLAWSYHKMGRYEEAIGSSKQAIRIKPDLTSAHFNLGNNYLVLGKDQEAMEAFKEAIRIRFDYAEAHLNLGAAYYRLGRFEDAIESYRQAARIKPRLAEAYLDLGMAQLKVGNRGDALEAYKTLKDLDATLANKLFNLIYE
jgi:tetratricopeptide (TPR) repeat protein